MDEASHMDELTLELMELLKAERAETVRLTNILLTRAGFLDVPESTVHIESSPGKVRLGNESWNSMRARLEKLHGKPKSAEYWREQIVKEELKDLEVKESASEVS